MILEVFFKHILMFIGRVGYIVKPVNFAACIDNGFGIDSVFVFLAQETGSIILAIFETHSLVLILNKYL